MKFLIALSFATLVATPVLAQQTTIFADSEATDSAPTTQGDSISLDGFSGGVSTTDSHDGGGGMMIQMLMPGTASAASGTPGPFVARAAVGASH